MHLHHIFVVHKVLINVNKKIDANIQPKQKKMLFTSFS